LGTGIDEQLAGYARHRSVFKCVFSNKIPLIIFICLHGHISWDWERGSMKVTHKANQKGHPTGWP